MEKLPVVETFYSLQGEGFHAGQPAYFVRLAGCHNACSFCDTPQSWNPDGFPKVSVADLAQKAQKSGALNCVVTGGEPTIHDLDFLCNALKSRGLKCWLETSGCGKLSGNWDWICLSPKKNIPVLPEYYEHASELKVVIGAVSDMVFAEEQAAKISPSCRCFLQPEWSVFNQILPKIIDYVKANPRWNLSLQIHKIIGVE